MDIKELADILRENGVVGAGGAGFPTYAKLNQAADTIILNCAECEPLLKLHQQLLEQYAYEILEALHLIGQAVGAKDVVIGIKNAYKKTIAALNEWIGEYPEMRLGLLDEVYPAGDEVVLLYEVTKRVVRPGGLPIECGAAIFNVETVYNVYRAVRHKIPNMDKIVSVVGEVEHPVTVRVPLGTSIEETVALAGGITTERPVYFIGGPMMGTIGNGTGPVTKTTNAVLVLPEDHIIIRKKQRKASIDLKRAAASCCQCTMCTDLCPRHQLGHPVTPNEFMRAATCKDLQQSQVYLNTMFCSSCGLCEMYSCMQSLAPRSLMAEYKEGLRANGVKLPRDVEAVPVDESRKYRKVPMKRLMARLELTKYDRPAPLDNETKAVRRVKILMSQHIGAPAVPGVAVGDVVKAGQVVGLAADGLSVAVHASISGKVLGVTDKYVIIQN